MLINVNGISIFCSYNKREIPSNKIPIVFLHGFTGSSEDWLQIMGSLNDRFVPIAIDLVGHGLSDSPENIDTYTERGISNQIKIVLEYYGIINVILCGYSMGGRAALSFSLKNPRLVKALILESTTAGIKESEEKELRIARDGLHIKKIQSTRIEEFIDFWMSQPIFSSQNSISQGKFERIKKRKLLNTKVGLVNSLTGFGTGIMPSYWDMLRNINIPVLLMCGALDKKYVDLNKRMHELLPNSELNIVGECGHNIHLERHTEFVSLVNNFIDNF